MCNDSLRHLSTLLAGSLLVGLILLVQPGHAQPQQLNFDHYTIDDGLANGSALSILQDRQGFMWFGTGLGLTNGYVSKFDGYTFTNYAQITGDTTSFGGGYAWALLEDRHGVLWIGSGNGLNRFDPTTETFTRYDLVTSDTTSLPGGVRVLYEDQEGVLWIGTGGSGLLRFNPRTESFIGYQQDPQNPTRLLGTIVSSIVEDQTGTLWIGTWDGGLTRYDRQKNTVVHYTHDPLNPHSLPFPTVTSLVIDHTGTLWVGSLGLSRYDPATDAFTTFYPDPDHLTKDLADPLFFNNVIGNLYQDRAGNLWAGTRSGLLHFDPETEAFTAFKRDPDHPGSLNGDWVTSIFEDRFGALWVGTQFMGLNRADRSTSLIPHHLPAPNDAQSPRNYIQALLESRDGSLWVGNLDGVLERTDSLNNTIRRYQHDPSNPASLSPGNAQAMLEDATGVIWIGTGLQYDSHMPGGLNRYDPKTDTFTRNLFDPELPALQVLALTEPPSAPGILWIGTWNGLYRYDTRTTAVTHYTHDPTNPYSLSDPVVFSIYEDLGGTLWVGTEQGLNRLNRPYEPLRGDTETEVFTRFLHSNLDDEVVAIHEDQQAPGILWIASRGGSGLMRFDTKTEQFSFFTEANSGLANNAVYGILDDADGNLWLSTNNGLSRFTPKTGQFKNYGVSQGVQSREFNRGSYHKGHSGTLYFGGINGYNAFKPRDLRGNPYPPELVITDLKLFNISVEPAPDGILQEPISTTEALTLAYEENDLSFDYVGLHFSNTKKIQYAYWLENYEDDWRYVGTQRTATYTNLDPGTYTFRVKAANSDGVWNETGASVEITIHPPWWRTMWAYLLYGLLFIGGVFVVDRFQRKRLIRKEREQSFLREKELRADAAEAMANYLQSENLRQTQELDAARDLQLSMLPEAMPEHPTVELAAFMQTATEVGGDYYDFDLSDDGTLTLAIGDATGHGTKAGTMVTAAKSLFANMAGEEDLVQILEKSARALKKMGLPKLYMALALVRLRDHTLELAGAGMPPALVYRAATGQVETVALKGMPLGGPGSFPYQTTSVPLSPGDTVVLMSDGFPELFNAEGEMLGYERAVEVFEEVASQSPEQIIAHLREAGERWSNGRAQDDDVTFVIMKMKASTGDQSAGAV